MCIKCYHKGLTFWITYISQKRERHVINIPCLLFDMTLARPKEPIHEAVSCPLIIVAKRHSSQIYAAFKDNKHAYRVCRVVAASGDTFQVCDGPSNLVILKFGVSQAYQESAEGDGPLFQGMEEKTNTHTLCAHSCAHIAWRLIPEPLSCHD